MLYEYTVVEYPGPVNAGALEEELNAFARQGFRLAQVTSLASAGCTPGQLVAVMEREMPDGE